MQNEKHKSKKPLEISEEDVERLEKVRLVTPEELEDAVGGLMRALPTPHDPGT